MTSPIASGHTTAARLLVEQLQLNGVDRIFCVPGESYLAVLDALCDAPEIDVVICRHEGGAAMMADAYARLTGRPGIAFVTRGPGATNASAGIHVSHQDSVPVILFIGDIERAAKGRKAFQEIDFEEMFRPITKSVDRITDGNRIPELIGRAFYTATAGRPGPVVLTLHEDMLLDEVSRSPVRAHKAIDAGPSATALAALKAEIAAAKSPVVIVGGGGWSQAAAEALAQVATHHGLAVATSHRCADYIDNLHPCYIGNLGLGANPKLRDAITTSDLVILLGGRLNEISSGSFSLLGFPAPRNRMIHIHPDPEELGSIYQPDLAINATAASVALALAEGMPQTPAKSAAWIEPLRASYLDWTTPGPVVGPLQLGEVMTFLRDELPEDAIITNGAGNFAIWPNRFHRYRGYGTQLAPRSGSMGYGVPAAVAAKIAHRDRLVVCFAGDGDFMMTANELATALMQEAPIVIILVNNSTYGTIRMHQERDFPGRVHGTSLRNPDFDLFVRAFDGHAERVTKTEDFAPAFRRARDSGKIALVELMVDQELLSPTATVSSLRAKAGL